MTSDVFSDWLTSLVSSLIKCYIHLVRCNAWWICSWKVTRIHWLSYANPFSQCVSNLNARIVNIQLSIIVLSNQF